MSLPWEFQVGDRPVVLVYKIQVSLFQKGIYPSFLEIIWEDSGGDDELTTVVKIGLTAGRIHFGKSVGIGSASHLLLGDLSTNLHTSSSLKGWNSLSVGCVYARVGCM